MGAADGRYVGRVRQNCQPRRDAGVVRHGCVQLPLDGALADAAFDEGVGGVHVPADLLFEDIGDVFGGAVALPPEDTHHLEFGIE